MNEPVQDMPLHTDEDVVRLRKLARDMLVRLGFSLVEQTKMVTAASELARNTLRYGGGGQAHLRELSEGTRRGIELVFADEGPGIADIGLALTDGYTSGGGLGLGLSGAKRLSDEFEIRTAPGEGTEVTIRKWKMF
ncbi:anti-sigma regulatory factor [Herbaspirillum sp. YR522]|uniref:anti-sigma regulatory factor n=1 Tax=Herbaspirillum sp. YR522 TaxID=1144342 RepID=UPI00026F5CF9|nr:anti-sigma regulatory factor [Herbaspirillum sp. YR522]EJM97520.1 anti-sigma regulatory factor (Ser/Thr protein kinase) [Herbaspirillum sp. YR522]